MSSAMERRISCLAAAETESGAKPFDLVANNLVKLSSLQPFRGRRGAGKRTQPIAVVLSS